MPDANDMDLVREYATTNSEPAFETLVRRHVSLVYSVALRQVANPAQAEEITQAVFLILARKAARLRPDTVLAAWLHETARFASASFLRGESRRHRREQEAYMQSKLQESAADPAWEQLAPLLDEAIGQLGKADRNAVVLRFFQNKSAREIAAALNVHESAAQKRLNRAVEKLRAWFLKRGVAVSADALTGALLVNSVPGAPAHLAASVMAVSAKGTIVSSSTLTLIKGALKIMAWTKAKTAIVAGVVVLLGVGTTTITVKEIRKHQTYPWQVQNADTRILDRVPPEVKIVPTIFPPTDLGFNMLNNKMLGMGQTINSLLGAAYQVSRYRIVFSTKPPVGNYDFIANFPDGNSEALQREIEKQFNLTARKETRETDVLVLTRKYRNAPGLKPNPGKSSDSNNHYVAGSWRGSNLSSTNIAGRLEKFFKIPVINRTDLAGRFNVDLKWDEQVAGQNPDAFKQALLDQLGLELVPGRESIEMLVVERANN